MPKPSKREAYKKYKSREVALKALSHLYSKPKRFEQKQTRAITGTHPIGALSLKPHCTEAEIYIKIGFAGLTPGHPPGTFFGR